jgi:hypothetical protein
MAEHTGGMLALIPDNAKALAVDDGDDPSDLHLTLLYLGDDVTVWPEGQADRLRELITASAPALDAVVGRVFGHAVLNPDGYDDREPCAAYLVGDTDQLDVLRHWALWAMRTGEDYAEPPEQHNPVLYHVTAGYGVGVDELSYVGPVRFGTMRLALGDTVLDVPLGDQEADVPGPEIKSITFTPSRAVRDAAAELELDGETATAVIEGKALNAEGLVWVAAHCGAIGQQWAGEMLDRVEVKRAGQINTGDMNLGRTEGGDRPKLDSLEDLDADIAAHGNTPEADRPARVRHLRKRAHHLGADKHVHAKIDAIGGEGLGVKSLEDGIEVKLMSPSPGAAKLREYWAHSAEGRAKWKPGIPGDFKRLRRHLAKYVHNPHILDGLTANIHKLATGEWPGKNAHTGKGNVGRKLVTAAKSIDWDGVEVKSGELSVEALHAGIEDWGQVFIEPWITDYIAALDPASLTEGPVTGDDLGTDLAQFAAMVLVADPGPAVPVEATPVESS